MEMGPTEKPKTKEDSMRKELEREESSYLRVRHKEVKKWYNDHEEMKEKYGKFPMFWQELKEWKYWREVESEYNTSTLKSVEIIPKREKRNRWTDASSLVKRSKFDNVRPIIQPGLSMAVASGVIAIEQVQEIQLRVRVRDLTNRLDRVDAEAILISADPNRSPSPPPVYDSAGNRVNTRAMRMRQMIEQERNEIVEEILSLNPLLRETLHDCKFQCKIYIPQDQYPNYNFVGQILGPRGKSHRKLENDTHTKIIIRGRGSTREGKDPIDGIGQDEPLHVIITGDREEDVHEAEKSIREILKVKDDDKNPFKQAQMRELAIINGQVAVGVYCSICGERGHNQYNCPNKPRSFTPANVVCAICGETSHLTRDCPERHNKKKVEESRKRDLAYLEFMNELDGGNTPTEKEEPKDVPSPPLMPSVVSPMTPSPIPENEDLQGEDPDNNSTASVRTIPPSPMILSASAIQPITPIPQAPSIPPAPQTPVPAVAPASTLPPAPVVAPTTALPPAPVMVPTPNTVATIPTGSLPSIPLFPKPTALPKSTNTPLQTPLVPVIRPGSISYASPPALAWPQQQTLLSNMQAVFAAMYKAQKK